MSGREQHEDIQDIVRRLEAERPEATEFELDRIKVAAMARASRGRARRGFASSRRLASVVAVLVVMGGGSTVYAWGGFAGASSSHHHGGAADHQYKPGKGCGDKNHQHDREDECKPPKPKPHK